MPVVSTTALRLLTLLAQLLLGLMAGFFFAFAIDVAPAMAQLDASGYLATQQLINRVVRNAAFGGVYFGSALLPFAVAATALALGRRRQALQWLVLAAAYAGLVFLLTREINVPINNLVATLDPAHPPAGWTDLRERWNAANDLRALAAALCFAASLWAAPAPALAGR